ncbi:ABC transporter permease [Nonomuraea salmonea]|uniref:ABC transporter permease n=1 Tax=Nonomuraea salmonea TaxID=46181 RepID=A0ABV5P3X5_9ACTN
MLRAELRKLKRSSSWLIALILPLLAVTTGTINFRNNEEVFQRDWTTLASQITLFYGLLFFSMGVGVLAATAWRVEHRGTNWNLLLTTTRRPLELVLAKIAVIAVPVAFMQVVLVAGIFVSGAFVVGLDGVMPADFVLAGALTVVAALPLIALQSLLSMLLRSFAAPVAICLFGCVAGVATVTSVTLRPLSHVLPQGLNTRTINLGSNAVAGSGGVTFADAAPLLLPALALAAALAAVTFLALKPR